MAIDVVATLSVMLALAILIAVGGSLWNRIKTGKGLGWQFIRYNTIATALPLVGLLALNNALTPAVTAIVAGALGYSFGKADEDGQS
jgi:hypothetical protein